MKRVITKVTKTDLCAMIVAEIQNDPIFELFLYHSRIKWLFIQLIMDRLDDSRQYGELIIKRKLEGLLHSYDPIKKVTEGTSNVHAWRKYSDKWFKERWCIPVYHEKRILSNVMKRRIAI